MSSFPSKNLLITRHRSFSVSVAEATPHPIPLVGLFIYKNLSKVSSSKGMSRLATKFRVTCLYLRIRVRTHATKYTYVKVIGAGRGRIFTYHCDTWPL